MTMTNTKADAALLHHLSFPTGIMRLQTILLGLELEIKTNGRMRLTGKAPMCATILRKEFGLSGSREKLHAQFLALMEKHGIVLVERT